MNIFSNALVGRELPLFRTFSLSFFDCHEPEATGLYTGCRRRLRTSSRLQDINRLYKNTAGYGLRVHW